MSTLVLKIRWLAIVPCLVACSANSNDNLSQPDGGSDSSAPYSDALTEPIVRTDPGVSVDAGVAGPGVSFDAATNTAETDCPLQSFYPPTERCKASTTACIQNATTNAARDVCYAADPDCQACVNDSYAACVVGTEQSPGRCAQQYACAVACALKHCSVTDAACGEQVKKTLCSNEYSAYVTCWDSTNLANNACYISTVETCFEKPVCGNQVLDVGETCDGDCPTTCPQPSDPCLQSKLVGSAATCDARCVTSQLPSCNIPPGSCYGTASGGVAQYSEVEDNNGKLGILISKGPPGQYTAQEVAVLIEVSAKSGQLHYSSSSGLVNCGVIQYTSAGWKGLEIMSGCSVTFDKLDFATTTGQCNGYIKGNYSGATSMGIGSGAFATPMDVAESQMIPSCVPYGKSCSKHSDCCSGSCMIYVGTCN